MCLDTSYLTQLGPQAIPAIDRLLGSADGRAADWAVWMARTRGDLAIAHRKRMQDWRAWTFRDRRLMRYLDQHPAIIPSEGQDGHLER